jgi:hypothetical protein
VRVASDGSAWVSASMGSNRERLWLGHFGASGELLGSAIVDNRTTPGHLEFDDHGNAWLLTGMLADGSSRLHRFNPAVHEIGTQVLAGSYTDLAPYPGEGMLISTGTQLRIVTAVDYEGLELWSRTDSGRAYACLAVDGDGNIAVGSGRNGGGGEGDVVLDWLDDPLGELGGTDYPLLQHEGYGPFAFMDMTFDAAGHLTLASAQPSLRTGSHRPQTNVERVDRVQGTLWRWQISSQPGPANAVDPRTGSTLVVATRTDAATSGQTIEPGLAVVAISPDGRSCRRFTVDGPDLFGDIDVGANGEIWFAGIKARPGSIVVDLGRWERPDL